MFAKMQKNTEFTQFEHNLYIKYTNYTIYEWFMNSGCKEAQKVFKKKQKMGNYCRNLKKSRRAKNLLTRKVRLPQHIYLMENC